MQKKPNPRAFLGKGWKFPPIFNNSTATNAIRVQMAETEEDIRESIKIILQTQIGERVLKPNFGSELDTMVFRPATEDTQIKIQDIASRALFDNEPRIKVEDVESYIKDNTIQVIISYTIIQSNVRANIVYPFYLEEGTYINSV